MDKTEYIYDLIQRKGHYFLSRPRRFGKSLLISTLKAIFEGKKELFKGYALYNKPYDWKTCPVLHFDLGNCDVQDAAELRQYFLEMLEASAKMFGIVLTRTGVAGKFTELVETLGQHEKAVILIDEYDKPILDNIRSKNIDGIRQVMEGFYSVVKSTEAYQRFVLLAGVSKFAKVSVFSKLNNLTDLTMDAKFATVLGYTQEELESNFTEYIEQAASATGMDRDLLLEKIKTWYNGYLFQRRAARVYNPVSVTKFFLSAGEFHNYWFATGTPTFLLKLAKEQQLDFEKALSEPVSELAFDSYEIDRLQALPLLFQTGYLTIKSSVEKFGRQLYYLGFPNQEVESAFEAYLLEKYAEIPKESVDTGIIDIASALNQGDIDGAMHKMQTFFTRIPYDIQVANEKYYQTIFYIIFRLLGLFIEAESRTNRGRIDAVVKTDNYIFIFEFKLNGSAEDALKQINDREYYQTYLDSGKNVTLVGAEFSTAERGLRKWLTEPVSENQVAIP